MASTAHHDAFLRVLAAAAWADGEIAPEELNVLKRWARDLGMGEEGWARLEPYLDEPIEKEEAEILVRDFFDRITAPSDRKALIAAVEAMAKADGSVDPRERELVEYLAYATQGASAAGVVIARLRTLFGFPREEIAEPFRHEDLETFRRHRILHRLRRRLRAAGLELPDAQLVPLACWATLLSRVAGADRVVTDTERERIRSVLLARMPVERPVLDLVVGATCEAARDDLDRTRAISDLVERTTPDHRIDVVEALFEVASADGPVGPEALRELRSIARALNVPQRRFADAKARASAQGDVEASRDAS